MKIYFKILSIFVLLAAMPGCIHDEVIIPQRTVLFYIAGENSLDPYASANIKASIEGAVDNNLNGGHLLIYVDSRNDVPHLLKIIRNREGAIVTDTVKTYPEHNSASIEVMQGVIADVFRNRRFASHSTGLLLWSHGTSWLPSDIGTGGYLNPSLRAFGQDGRDWMEINMLRDALDGYHFDFMIFDACYMAGVEVIYALRNNADYILASPTEVIAEGLPYRKAIKTMFSDQPVDRIMQNLSSQFMNYYFAMQGLSQSASTVVVRTEGLDRLASAARAVFSAKDSTTLYDLPLSQIQVLERLTANPFLYDFEDYASHLADGQQLASLRNALNDVTVYKATTEQAFYANFPTRTFAVDSNRYCGMSAYIPQKGYTLLNNWYKRLDWYKAVYE
ncbi:MAG: clostripain [Tannerellaceae bacterium]|nr:clostripain [Tannerellaceae bacterium]